MDLFYKMIDISELRALGDNSFRVFSYIYYFILKSNKFTNIHIDIYNFFINKMGKASNIWKISEYRRFYLA